VVRCRWRDLFALESSMKVEERGNMVEAGDRRYVYLFLVVILLKRNEKMTSIEFCDHGNRLLRTLTISPSL
jgi:hypothetical protein